MACARETARHADSLQSMVSNRGVGARCPAHLVACGVEKLGDIPRAAFLPISEVSAGLPLQSTLSIGARIISPSNEVPEWATAPPTSQLCDLRSRAGSRRVALLSLHSKPDSQTMRQLTNCPSWPAGSVGSLVSALLIAGIPRLARSLAPWNKAAEMWAELPLLSLLLASMTNCQQHMCRHWPLPSPRSRKSPETCLWVRPSLSLQAERG